MICMRILKCLPRRGWSSPKICSSQRYLSFGNDKSHSENEHGSRPWRFWIQATAVSGIVAGVSLYLYSHREKALLFADTREHGTKQSPIKPDLPTYSMKEVRQHDSMEKRIWVTFKSGVYDITDFISHHPEIIKNAAGRPVEPFFDMYPVHWEKPWISKMMEKYRIGNLRKDDTDQQTLNASSSSKQLPKYSLKEVQMHDSEEKRIWVTYKTGVYDITDFIPLHPGAKNVTMAAGGAVEPFWEIYAVHKDNPEVLKMLEEYRIGDLCDEDVQHLQTEVVNDPFQNEPTRHKALKPSSLKPFNAETPASLLTENFLTPNDLFYVRNHLPTPDVQAENYELEINGIGLKGEKLLTLDDIKKFPKHTVVAAIQCGGNRRSEMKQVRDVKGLDWGAGAIGNAKWSGAKLSDVLQAAGLDIKNPESLHVQFEGYDLGADGSPYGASIPLEIGLNPLSDVILAYEMNGVVLPRDHGFPIRVVVPGVVGARNVKWLNRIVISNAESDSHWQQNDYKGFNPSVTWENVDFSKSPAIQNMPVTSAICQPENGATVHAGEELEIRGYAWSGGGNRIIRVDITIDGGKTWQEAEIVEQDSKKEPRHYGWTVFRSKVRVPKGVDQFTVMSKAVDSSYNVQPESFENIWNLRGLLSNAYSRVTFNIK